MSGSPQKCGNLSVNAPCSTGLVSFARLEDDGCSNKFGPNYRKTAKPGQHKSATWLKLSSQGGGHSGSLPPSERMVLGSIGDRHLPMPPNNDNSDGWEDCVVCKRGSPREPPPHQYQPNPHWQCNTNRWGNTGDGRGFDQQCARGASGMCAEDIKAGLHGIKLEGDLKVGLENQGDGEHWPKFAALVQAIWGSHRDLPPTPLGDCCPYPQRQWQLSWDWPLRAYIESVWANNGSLIECIWAPQLASWLPQWIWHWHCRGRGQGWLTASVPRAGALLWDLLGP